MLIPTRPLPALSLVLMMTSASLADPVISEFMASNATTIKDGRGNYEDWVEIWNPDPTPIDLAGWRLTDSATNLGKFIFPSKTIPAGGRVIVFCSNRAGSTGASTYVDALGYLHTNFALSKSGEFLALAKPDGVTTTTAFNPFPTQIDDISYGPPASTTNLVTTTGTVRYKVPISAADDTANPNWRSNTFADTSWTSATGHGLGYEIGAPTAVWMLDENASATSATDSTGSGFNAGLNGTGQTFGVAGVNANTNTAVSLNGSGGLTVPFTSALNPSTAFTFAAWVHPTTTTGGHQAVVSSRVGPGGLQRGFILYMAPSGGTLRWEFWTGTVGTWHVVNGPNVIANAWTHVAITRNAAGNKQLWINGTSVASEVGGYVANNVTANGFHLGCGDDLGSSFRFTGSIDDVGFWSSDIGSSLIGQHMMNGIDTFPTPLYGNHFQTNVTAPMFGVNPGIYTRHAFTVADKTNFATIKLRAKYDDGFVAYLNGTEIARRNFVGSRNYNSLATSDRTENDAVVYEDIDVTTSSLPVIANGANTLAIHGMTNTTGSIDFLLSPALEAGLTPAAQAPGYFLTATPGTTNSSSNINPGPEITLVSHTPIRPAVGTSLTVTANVAPRFSPIASVTLKYRIMYGTESSAIAMLDNGVAPDALAGDGIYSATIANAGGGTVRQMLRYYITASDTAARTWREPYPVDLTNDDGASQSPEYFGTVIADPTLTASMPIMEWFTNDVPNSDTRTGSRASAFYDEKFYDNIYVRQRGGYTSSGSQKFNFNAKHGIYVNGTLGTVGELNMNSSGGDPAHFRVSTAYSIYRAAGHPALECFPVAMVRNGTPHRMAQLIEQLDEDFLKRKGFDNDGALYKFVQRLGEQNTPGNVVGNDYSGSPGFKNENPIYGVEKKTRLHEGFEDFNAFTAGIGTGTAADKKRFIFNNLNVPNFVNFMAVRALVAEEDVNRKNFYAFRDSDVSQEWFLFPWDKDMTQGIGYNTDVASNRNNPWSATNTYKHDPGATKQWNVLWQAGYDIPEVRAMVGRRLRTLMDTMMGAVGATIPGNTVMELRLEEIRAMLQTPPTGLTVSGDYNNRNSWNTWLGQHRTALFTTYGPSSSYDMIPVTAIASPVVTITNAVSNPPAASVGYGAQDHEYIELTNSNAQDVDISEWSLWNPGSLTPLITFTSGTVIPGSSSAPLNKLFVARDLPGFRNRPGAPTTPEFVVGNYDGQISARGEVLELRRGPLATSALVSTFNTPIAPTAAQQFLRVTKLMYDPAAVSFDESQQLPTVTNGQFEYIELQNIGTAPLDLDGCKFTDGVEFTFPPATTLSAGSRITVAANLAAFDLRYGTGLNVVGPYTGAFDNLGERIRIEDGGGEEVLDFIYSPTWYPNTTQQNALVFEDSSAPYDTWSDPLNWRTSSTATGTPGAVDPLPAPASISSYDGATLFLTGIAGRTYILQRSLNLGAWENVATVVAEPDGSLQATDPAPPANRAFYRLQSK